MHFAAEVSYNGGLFCGWQTQPWLATVQKELERVLSLLDGAPIKVTGSGRTDAGVHARAQMCSFEMSRCWAADKLMLAVNANLAPGIQLMRAAKAPDGFNARFDAQSREYVYFIWNAPAIYPHITPFVCHIKARGYDWNSVRKACQLLEGTHDFSAFCKKTEIPQNAVRTLESVRLYKRGALVWLHVKGNAFLMNMIRIMLGNLELVALSKKSPEFISNLLKNGCREEGGRTFPPHGLFFWRANYKYRLFC